MKFIEDFLAEHKGAIIVLLLLVSITGGVLGFRYYRDTQENPAFCAKCHMMQESFRGWETSSHRDVICQRCHKMTMLEQNRLLVAYVMTGYTSPREEKHGRIAPWQTCRTCHLGEVQQGSVSMRKSFGHARHVFMENIECIQCHDSDLHNFGPDEAACRKCHSDRLVHGLGMEGLTCLKCHSYGDETSQPVSDAKCLGCHGDVPGTGPMAMIHCFECHKPHGELKLTNDDCLGNCHGNEAQVGQHELHMKKTGLGCLDCHKAHTWSIGKAQAPGLCDRCHRIKDPMTFIY